jgi:biotin operon repressor
MFMVKKQQKTTNSKKRKMTKVEIKQKKRRAKIREMLVKNKTQEEMAEELNCDRSTVVKDLKHIYKENMKTVLAQDGFDPLAEQTIRLCDETIEDLIELHKMALGDYDFKTANQIKKNIIDTQQKKIEMLAKLGVRIQPQTSGMEVNVNNIQNNQNNFNMLTVLRAIRENEKQKGLTPEEALIKCRS